nr:FMRFa-like protein precursor 11 [Ascaris suum]
MSPLHVALFLIFCSSQVLGECCNDGQTSDFCAVFNMLSPTEQAEVRSYLGDNCDGDADEAVRKIEKRKPNFIRFGRTAPPLTFGKKGSDPNFLRFGRTPSNNFLRFGKSNQAQNFLRFGRNAEPNFLRFGRPADPNFLRFGKSAEPNFLRFGKRSDIGISEPNFLRFGRNNFLRFGRNDQFDREYRKPNFLRFGK